MRDFLNEVLMLLEKEGAQAKAGISVSLNIERKVLTNILKDAVTKGLIQENIPEKSLADQPRTYECTEAGRSAIVKVDVEEASSDGLEEVIENGLDTLLRNRHKKDPPPASEDAKVVQQPKRIGWNTPQYFELFETQYHIPREERKSCKEIADMTPEEGQEWLKKLDAKLKPIAKKLATALVQISDLQKQLAEATATPVASATAPLPILPVTDAKESDTAFIVIAIAVCLVFGLGMLFI